MTISVPAEYGLVIFTAALMGFQCIFQGFSTMGARTKVFSKEFFKTNFPGQKVARGGYPDMGNGRYAAKLSDEDWLLFNNAQRAHYNYLEVIAPMIAIELLAGLFYPRLAVLLGVAYCVGRFLYFWGYNKSGASGRVISLPLVDGAMLALFGLTFYGSFNAAGGIAGVLALFKF